MYTEHKGKKIILMKGASEKKTNAGDGNQQTSDGCQLKKGDKCM